MNPSADVESAAVVDRSLRLDSWKEIASYLNRGVSTVQRWEREEGLPVHRQQHDSLGSVYAFKGELEAWRAARAVQAESGDDRLGPDPVRQSQPFPRWLGSHPISTLVGVGLLMLISAIGFTVRFAATEAPKRVQRLTLVPPGNAPLVINGTLRDLAITPDGTRVVYIGGPGASRLLVRGLDHLDVSAIIGVGAPRHPFISPDGQWIGFFDAGTSLKKVPITGGSATTVAAAGPRGPGRTDDQLPGLESAGARGATWGPDNKIIFAARTGLLRVSADGGEPEVLLMPERQRGEAAFCWPEYISGGRALLFTIIPTGDWSEKGLRGATANARIAVLDLATGTRKVLLQGGTDAHYVESGHLVFAAEGALKAVPFNRSSLEIVGTPRMVVPQVRTSVRGAADFDVARDGTLAYAPGDLADDLVTLTWVDPHGREEQSLGMPPFVYRYPRLSPDGRRLAIGSFRDLGVWDFSSRALSWFGVGPASYPVWAPDGRRLIFASTRGGAARLYSLPVDGSEPMKPLTDSPLGQSPNAVSPDGSRLVFREEGPTMDLMVLDLSGGHRVEPLLQSPQFHELNADFSPDGKFVTYQSNASGEEEVYVQPFPNVTAQKWIVSRGGGSRPAWSRDGQQIFFISPAGEMMRVAVQRSGSTLAAATPVTLFHGPYYLGGGAVAGRTYDVAADGRFLMMKPVSGAPSPSSGGNIEVVVNWFEELKRAVPYQ
ncbi:MAG: hypothetical protein JWL71_3817 [Acidobacteria bacterium]|nr:hypothetical protein [Acidobacteriota bacterium]